MYLEGKFKEYMDDLAAKKSAPGGGSAAAAVGAMGVSLLSMVANFTLGKKEYQYVEPEIREILSSSEKLRIVLEQLVDEDVAAYKKVSEAYKMAKETEEEKKARAETIQAALRIAMEAPLAVCRNLYEAAKLCRPLLEKGNTNLVSDVGVGAEFIAAGFVAALLNVEINLASIDDSGLAANIRQELSEKEKKIQLIREKVVSKTKEKI
ncbi:MAG: cyclodeaminase/cyclohydrolase family protein [Phycisphaerae bacterium]|nr:cyclodeaminase/cyclohydrolase family protein [Phycisphaerae bacterium]